MQSTNIPTKIPLPFANSAGVGYITAIPVTSQIGIVDGRASLHDGFPPLNFTAISSGGIPPFGADVNGILFESTAILQWQQAGGFFPYDSAFSAYVGGYPKGAVIQAAAFAGFWTSTSENNTTNPDTGGAGWTPTAFTGLQSIPLSGASVTLTNLQSAAPIIVLTGALTQNCNVIISNFVDDWVIANNTTGAYTIQVKTAAGTGVNIAQSSSQYIWGDGTNIYYANASSVTSFNTRTGAITLNALDVTDALGYAPLQYAVTTLSGGTTGLTPSTATNGAITLAGTLGVPNGGSGVTTGTGTGSVVLNTSPTLITPNFNSASLVTISGTAPLYMCRAWVNFNGQGTVAIRASGNVSSITDNGTGDFTINFTTAMPDANYAACPSLGPTAGTVSDDAVVTTLLAGSVRIQTSYLYGTQKQFADYANTALSVFR